MTTQTACGTHAPNATTVSVPRVAGYASVVSPTTPITDYEIGAECTGYSVTEDDVERIQKSSLALTLTVPEADESRADGCLDIYEQGCTVGETLNRAIDFEVDRTLVLDDGVADED